ncbi:MAG: hypothetical protein RL318_2532 [Fibrobacterota bacterium]|jgi:cellulose synthase/poly-beta-1,6-N-acetylglucosamine synthase-like glycosyltransferase
MIATFFHWFSLFIQYGFLAYFLLLTAGVLLINLVAAVTITRHLNRTPTRNRAIHEAFSGFVPPISILVPAYNEEATIEATVRSLNQTNYPEYEIIVINDGSKDGTLEAARKAFGLELFPEAMQQRLSHAAIRGIYRSSLYPNLRLIDKENGGKADSLNAGINASRYPLFCGIDADSILQQDSLLRCVQPFLEDPRTIVSGGTIRLANGCKVEAGFLNEIGMPKNPLALVQVAEYLRAFLFGRLGWSPMNALLIVSGAFGIFHRETVVRVGGYSVGTIGEDMELIVRLHDVMIREGKAYRIVFVPDPICWTEAPETLKVLRSQRIRWQRGLLESLWKHRSLMFRRGSGAVGWLSFPYMTLFEAIEPLIEVGGIVFFLVSAWFGVIDWSAAVLFLVLVYVLGFLQTLNAVLLEEVSYRLFQNYRQIFKLLFATLLESFGYRQMNTWWRLLGVIQWALKRKQEWGNMTRKASWASDGDVRR